MQPGTLANKQANKQQQQQFHHYHNIFIIAILKQTCLVIHLLAQSIDSVALINNAASYILLDKLDGLRAAPLDIPVVSLWNAEWNLKSDDCFGDAGSFCWNQEQRKLSFYLFWKVLELIIDINFGTCKLLTKFTWLPVLCRMLMEHLSLRSFLLKTKTSKNLHLWSITWWWSLQQDMWQHLESKSTHYIFTPIVVQSKVIVWNNLIQRGMEAFVTDVACRVDFPLCLMLHLASYTRESHVSTRTSLERASPSLLCWLETSLI